MPGRPIAEDLFTWPATATGAATAADTAAGPSLIGCRCQDCGTYAFPLRTGCPKCGATSMQRCALSPTGTLWTWTSQGFLPKAPFNGTFMEDPFKPWYVGLIELPGQLRVESILLGCTQDTLRIGMPMRLVTFPFRTDEDGGEVVTFAFAPAETGDTNA